MSDTKPLKEQSSNALPSHDHHHAIIVMLENTR
jgi:hypothetical protein